MGATETESQQRELKAENERLRARLAALEQELVEVQARTNAAVGRYQEQVYWFARWQIDPNKLMQRRGANELRLALRAVRSVFWRLKRLKRRLLGS
jgi:P pilus assembly chaperone PapD